MLANLTKMTDSLADNPLVAAGYALLAAAALIAISSIAMLLTAFLYSPSVNLGSTIQESAIKISPEQITERNFFGFADAEPEIVVDDLPETKLELTLRAAFAASEQNEQAGAIIENDENKISNHYTVGEELPGEATLKAIYVDRVVLSRNGLLETLYFPDISDSTGIDASKNVSIQGSPASAASDEAKARREAIRERIKQLRNRK